MRLKQNSIKKSIKKSIEKVNRKTVFDGKTMDNFPSKEFPIFFGRAVVGAVPDLKNTKTFSVFNSENKDVLI